MAENKYDLLLVPTKTDSIIKKQPWYKERLQTKYLKKRKPSETSPNLIGRNWLLVRSGMDDFRTGKPLDFNGQYVVEGSKGISPVIKRHQDTLSSRLRRENIDASNTRPKLTKTQVVYDKQLPRQRHRVDHINEIEYGLTQHPLALYPHLEEGMSPELFEEIVDLLDPAMNPDIESEAGGESTETEQVDPPPQERSNAAEEQRQEENLEEKRQPIEAKSRNPYKWILQKDNAQKDEKRGLKKRPTSPSQDEHIKKVTKEFCDWVSDLGGESNNVEESTIMSLFASGYETKPALSVPIHVVELSNVPSELRLNANVSPSGSAKKSRTSSAIPTNPTRKEEEAPEYQPSWVKIKYGAWYLDPETWQVRPECEPLVDPDEIAKREKSESKQKSMEMDSQLAPLHGAKAFREFLEKSGKRKPEFMDRVSYLQDQETNRNEMMQQKLNRPQSRQATARTRSSLGEGSFISLATPR